MAIKAIQTSYGGCLFRSRTEARWAVMFDALGIKWEYEKEGFELPSGRYLPDFWIPEWEAWVEVKGGEPTQEETDLANELSAATRCRVMIVCGIPQQGAEQIHSAYLLGLRLAEDDKGFVLASSLTQNYDCIMPLPHRYVSPYVLTEAKITPRLKVAITKARSARFEFGARN